MKLERDFYSRDDVVLIARELLGKYLMTRINGVVSGGKIIETEAYAGITDRASHAYGGLRTARTEIMYADGGHAYIYLCYGVHYLFNVVTNISGVPHAVLIRAIAPIDGVPEMLVRTNKKSPHLIGDGPGKLTKALGIDMAFNKMKLSGDTIWIEDRKEMVSDDKIAANTRIGIGYAGEDAKLLYRFNLIP